MKKEEAIELAKEYPAAIHCVPRARFIEQLAEFLIKIESKLKK